MSAATVNLTVDQGEDFSAQIVWTDSADEAMNVISPARMWVKDATGAIVLELETTDVEDDGVIPEIVTSSSMGLIQIHIAKETTANLPAGQYAYDLFVTVDDGDAYAGNQTHRLIRGIFEVQRRYTEMTGS